MPVEKLELTSRVRDYTATFQPDDAFVTSSDPEGNRFCVVDASERPDE